MDLVTMAIITALADDDSGSANLGKSNITEAYNALKSVLKQTFGVESTLLEAMELLEKRPDSAARKEVLQEEVITAQAHQLPEALLAAQTLLDRINRVDEKASTTDDPAAGPADSPYLPLQRPTRADHFTGREAELEQLLSSLQPGKVITLCGPGGVGKSALAAKAVWSLAPDTTPPEKFPNGIIYHSFYTQPQVMLALERIARAFGEEIRPNPQQAARRALKNRQVLLVLDGAEQADNLDELLAIREDCGVLITSRREQDAAQEKQAIAPLSLDEAVSLLELEAWGWVRKSDKAAAQEICQLVGQLPLSVRLVGRYLATRKQRLKDFLDWLNETPLPKLDQTRRCEQSVPLLLERSLAKIGDIAYQALAVIGLLAQAPFGQDIVAEALSRRSRRGLFGTVQKLFRQRPDETVPEISLALDQLVNYGLLQWVGRGYQISHPLILSYARRQLMPPLDATQHLVAYYTNLVGEQILLGLDGYARLDAERPHLIAVLTSCIGRGDWESAHSLAAAIEDYLDLQGHWTERVIANQAGLTASRKLKLYSEGSWLGNLGLAYSNGGQPKQAIDFYEQALTLARKNGDRRSEGNWLGNLGLAYRDLEQIELARQYLRQSVAIFEEIQSPSADLIRDWLAEFEEE